MTEPIMIDALRIIIAGSPEAARLAAQTMRAIMAGGPKTAVQQRYNWVAELALSDPQAEFTREQRTLIAGLMEFPGSDSDDRRGTNLVVRITETERAVLQAEAEAEGVTVSQLVRSRLLR